MNKNQPKSKSPVRNKKITRAKIQPQKKQAIKKRIKQNRPPHKRFLLHPAVIFLWLCVGVLIIGWTYRVIAASYTVTATVPAPPLQEGAAITYPISGQVFSSQTLTVQGSCQQESYINLYDNSLFVGVAWCSSANTFSIQDTLFSGQNVFSAEAFNITNEEGPVTPDVSVTYSPAENATVPKSSASTQVPTSTPASTTKSNTTTLPLVLEGNFSFQTFVVGNAFSWTISLSGGLPPYNLTIDWGDGQKTTETLQSDPTFTLTHTYSNPGYYAVIVHSTDQDGNQSTLQLAALIKSPGATGFATTTNSSPTTKGSNNSISHIILSVKNSWLILAWPSYAILALMIASFWLGERREYSRLSRSRQRKHKHA